MMAQLKVTWKESGKEELVEVADEVSAAEYKAARFGTPASEVTVEIVEAAPAKKPAAPAKKSLELKVEAE